MRKSQDVIEITLPQMIRALKKRWWLLCVLSILLAAGGFFIAKVTYIPQYSSTATFVVSNKTSQTVDESEASQISSSDLSASSSLANTFQYILLSDEALNAIIEQYHLDATTERLKSMIEVSPVSETNILEMCVTTKDAALSKGIADTIIEFYPDVLSRTLKTASLEILNAPTLALQPDNNHDTVTYALVGLLLGIAVAGFIIFMKENFSNTFLTGADIGNRLDLNVMVSVPRVVRKKRKGRIEPALLISNYGCGFSFIETYKALRTKIERIAHKKAYKSFMITSSLENEGKTTVAANLALALAQNGKTVLLVDADLRKPTIYRLFELSSENGAVGLGQVLLGQAAIQDAIVATKHSSLYVIPNFSQISNSSELLSSVRMKEILEYASEQFDYILVDSPPSGLVADSAVLTACTDGVILVVRQDFSSADEVTGVVSDLTESRAELVGCVFNQEEYSELGGFKPGSNQYKKYSYGYPISKVN
ncbi:MAG: capsular exopolysaccharide family [Oscillospiraceae bacterium]|nr:capsular exopolysaccharide family [Oscillospiraceae bacterium]